MLMPMFPVIVEPVSVVRVGIVIVRSMGRGVAAIVLPLQVP